MTSDRAPSVGEALAAFQRTNRLDPAPASASSWTCRVGPITLRLPNFAWRRAAIRRHDLHHILTGYSCTMRGEFQMATWEFAAGRFAHPGATLFCLPLVAAGLVWSPRAIWSAFRLGRNSSSLYGVRLTDELLRSPITSLRAATQASTLSGVRAADIVAFASLVTKSWLLVTIPIACFIGLVFGHA